MAKFRVAGPPFSFATLCGEFAVCNDISSGICCVGCGSGTTLKIKNLPCVESGDGIFVEIMGVTASDPVVCEGCNNINKIYEVPSIGNDATEMCTYEGTFDPVYTDGTVGFFPTFNCVDLNVYIAVYFDCCVDIDTGEVVFYVWLYCGAYEIRSWYNGEFLRIPDDGECHEFDATDLDVTISNPDSPCGTGPGTGGGSPECDWTGASFHITL